MEGWMDGGMEGGREEGKSLSHIWTYLMHGHLSYEHRRFPHICKEVLESVYCKKPFATIPAKGAKSVPQSTVLNSQSVQH